MPEAKHKGFVGSRGTGLPETIILRNSTAEFTRHATYNKGQTLVLLVRGEIEEAQDANGDPIEVDIAENPLIYPCGPGWESFDNGETAEHEQGKETFHENSGAAVFCQALVDLGLEDDMIAKGDSMTQASIYAGWDLYLERKEFNFGKNKTTGEEMKTTRMIPTKVLGAAEKATKTAKGAAKGAAKAVKAVAEDAADEAEGLLGNVDAKTLVKLKSAFKKADGDADAFNDLAIEIDGVTDDDDLVNAIADGSLYAELSE